MDVFVYALDDYAYFQNNVTDYNKNSWEAPILNFTRAIGGNFSYVPINCYYMLLEIQNNAQTKVDGFDTLGDFFLAFMFNIMGNSLKFRQAL